MTLSFSRERRPSANYNLFAAANLLVIFGTALVLLSPILGWSKQPYKPAVTIQLLLPVIALTAAKMFPTRFALFHGLSGGIWDLTRKQETKFALVAAFLPTLMVLFGIYRYMFLLSKVNALVLGFSVGGAFFAAAALTDKALWRKREVLNIACGALASLLWGYTAVIQLNCILDKSEPQIFEPVVIGRTQESPRVRTLTLAPWGPMRREETFAVEPSVYRSTTLGAKVCVIVKSGAFRISWFSVQTTPCDASRLSVDPGVEL